MGVTEGLGQFSADSIRMSAARAAARAVFAQKSTDSAFQRDLRQRTAANAEASPFSRPRTGARPRPTIDLKAQEVIDLGIQDDFRRHAKPAVVFTLDEDGNPELPDPRRRGGYFPYLTSGQLRLASDPGMLIDFHV